MKRLLFIILLSGASVFAGYDWSRYAGIAERAPFGKEPLAAETAEPARPSGEFAKQYRLCMLYKNAEGQLKAGIVSKVNNKSVLLQVGESEKGLSLTEVRLEEGIAILQMGGETAQLLLEGIGSPSSPLPQNGSAATALASVSVSQQIQQFRSTGARNAPEHILAGLADSSAKQAQITVRDTVSRPSEDSANIDNLRQASSSVAGSIVVAQAPAPANYLVQSVPQRYSPFNN